MRYDPVGVSCGSVNVIHFESRALYSEDVSIERHGHLKVATNYMGEIHHPIGRLITAYHSNELPERGVSLGAFELAQETEGLRRAEEILSQIAISSAYFEMYKVKVPILRLATKESWEESFDRAYALEQHFDIYTVFDAMRRLNINYEMLSAPEPK
jgi:hypothetical protein